MNETPLKVHVKRVLGSKEALSKKEIAERLDANPASIGYHLTNMRRNGEAKLVKGKWALGRDPKLNYNHPKVALNPEPKPNVTLQREPKPKPEPKPEPKQTSLMLSLTIAQEALADAIKRVEELEQLIYGEQ